MDQDKQPGLFGEFPEIPTQQWEEMIHQDLKGADYEKKLIWNTVEGIRVKPYYRSEDLENLSHMQALPAQYPFVRGSNIAENKWTIRQDIEEADPVKASEIAEKAIARGAEAIGFNAENINKVEHLQQLLHKIDPLITSIHFLHCSNYKPLFRDLEALATGAGWHLPNLKGSLNFDPLAFFMLYGKFYGSEKENYRDAMQILETGKGMPNFRVISVNGQHYHNAGAHIVQELAFTLSQGNEYLAALTEQGIAIDDLAPRMQFTLAVGSNYFLEIGKLRAFKMLWAKIVEQYKPENEGSMMANIHAVTSGWNKSVYDPYVNMLRTTTETMAAAIAGVDSITVEPFDATYKKADEFSTRIARNQQIVLKHEAYFNKVVDPSAGSYYIEHITDSLAQETWKLFVEMEERGGFVKAVESGFIKAEIEKTCQKRDMDIAMRKHVFVGVNQYPNLQEKMLEKIQPTARLDDLAQIKPYRGVQAFEAIRLAVENHALKGFKIPTIYLFTYGNLAMRKARATFATNFFGCAGYLLHEAPATSSLDEGIQKALEANADAVVFCSSDEEYAEMTVAAKAIREKQPATRIVVAGNPQEIIPQLNEAGVQHYIHMRTNTLETLQRFNELFGIA
jgi:methylmalonyl-CoA mutase